MALTLKTYPQDYMPVYNPVEVCFTSTSTAQANFKYRFKVYADAGTLIATFNVAPHPNDNEGRLDVSRALQRYIIEQIEQADISTLAFVYATNRPLRKYRIDCIEYYSSPATDPPQEWGEATTGSNVYVWDASFNYHDWVDQMIDANPFNTWLMNTTNGTSAKFLTDVTNHYVSINDVGRAYCLTDAPADVDYVEIKTYNSAGGLIDTFQVANAVTTTDDRARLVSVMSAPQTLNQYSGAFLLGAQPIITSSVASYTLQIFKTGGTAMSEIMDYTIQEPCRYTQYRLHYLNELGGFDAYNFLLRAKVDASITRKTYTRQEDFFTGTNEIAYVHRANGTQDYLVKSRDKLKLRTDWISEEVNNNLKQLIESPLVYLEFTNIKGEQDFKPVHITSKNWTEKIVSIDKTFMLEIDLQISHENYRQRR